MKTATFRKVNLTVKRGNGYGQYIVSAQYRGKHIEVNTTDSECFDWIDDNSNKEKHREAKQHAYMKVKVAYEATQNFNRSVARHVGSNVYKAQ